LPAIPDGLGLSLLVDHLTNSAEVAYEKPHPETCRLARDADGHPRETWMVVDNVVADVLGAERVGMRGILVRRADPRARRYCPDLGRVPGILGANRDETVRGG
jgi:putative hydrolase of the HAD superfamily